MEIVFWRFGDLTRNELRIVREGDQRSERERERERERGKGGKKTDEKMRGGCRLYLRAEAPTPSCGQTRRWTGSNGSHRSCPRLDLQGMLRLVGWLAGRLAGWLAGRLAGWLAGWLSGWIYLKIVFDFKISILN